MKNVKRIAAIVGLVLIVACLLTYVLSAVTATENSNGLFLASFFSLLVIPIMIWWFIAIYKWVHKKDEPNLQEKSKTNSNDKA